MSQLFEDIQAQSLSSHFPRRTLPSTCRPDLLPTARRLLRHRSYRVAARSPSLSLILPGASRQRFPPSLDFGLCVESTSRSNPRYPVRGSRATQILAQCGPNRQLAVLQQHEVRSFFRQITTLKKHHDYFLRYDKFHEFRIITVGLGRDPVPNSESLLRDGAWLLPQSLSACRTSRWAGR